MQKPDPKVPLALTEAERKPIVEDLEYVEDNYASVIRATPSDEPVRFTVDDWTGLADSIAAEVNHARDKRLKKELDQLYARILNLLDKPPTTLKIYRGGDENEISH